MQGITLSKRYARALLELSEDKGKTADFLNDLKSFQEALNQDGGRLSLAVVNPFFELAQRINVVSMVAQKLNLNPLVVNFLKFITKKGRMSLFSEIVLAFQQLHLQKIATLEARVTTSKKMSESFYNQITQILEKKTGKKVICTSQVDPKVLGGVSVNVDGKVFDGTILADLNRLEMKLKNLATL